MTIWRLTLGLVGVAFVIRYMVAERRDRANRQATIERTTRERLEPWLAWTSWRQHLIEAEHGID